MMVDAHLELIGYTEDCQRCTLVRCCQALRAMGARHSDERHKRLYAAMRKAGTEKLKRADIENASQTQTQCKVTKNTMS